MISRLAPLIAILCYCGVTPAQTLYFPPDHTAGEWATADPADLGWSTDSITALYDFLDAEQTDAFIVLKDGRIVLERYFGTYTADSLHYWASASKSLRGLLIGAARDEGLLGLDDRVSDYLGRGWTSLLPAREDSITLWHQVTMTTGLNEFDFFCGEPACLTFRAPAGTRWAYHQAPYSLTEQVLEAATGQSLNQLTNVHFEQRVGGSNGFWFRYNPSNTTYFSRARLMARFGLLFLNDGVWDGEPLIRDSSYVEAMLSPSQDLNPAYGYLWWLNGQDRYIGPDSPRSIDGMLAPDAPADVVLAAGADGQFVSISRSEGLVWIRQGADAGTSLAPIGLHNEIWRRLQGLRTTVSTSGGQNPPTENLRVYPNPATTGIRFVVPPGDGHLVSLYDQNGRLQRRRRGVDRLERGNLPAGLYRLVVTGEAGRASSWVRFE